MSLKICQINLQHSKAASAVLTSRFICDNIDLVLFQEPWVNGGSVRGLSTKVSKSIYDTTHMRPRCGIMIKNGINFLVITEFCRQDIVAVELELSVNGGRHTVIVCSAYFPGDSGGAPPKDFEDFMVWIKTRNKQLVVGCDSNAHHTLWGSTNINRRCEQLLDFLGTTDLTILNRGDRPTFMNRVRREVLDLTLCSAGIASSIGGWHVSDEVST